jgi:competence protein ComEA
MSLDKRYPAFLLILAIFLGLFLLTSNTFRKEPPATAPGDAAVVKADKPPQAASASRQSVKSSLPIFPIDLNKATLQELTLLPGIGEKTAQRIIEKRAELNGFRSVDDLLYVKWIGKVKLEKIRKLVAVDKQPKPKSGAKQ